MGVGIQRDHITNLCQQFGAGRGHNKISCWVRRRPACRSFAVKTLKNQSIKLAQLASLAFPAYPLAFGLAPLAWPVKKMKRHQRASAVSPVEFLDTVLGAFKNLSIVRQRFRRRIDEIAKQRKVYMLVLVCEIGNLELVEQRRDRCFVVENHRHNHHRTCF